MTDDNNLDHFIDLYLTFLDGQGEEPRVDGLPEHLRDRAAAEMQVIAAAWGVDSPPTGDDPLARRLGLDGRDSRTLDGRAVKRRRTAAGLDLSVLASRIVAAGADLDRSGLFRLEQSAAFTVSAMTAIALGAILDVDVTDLEAEPAGSLLDDARIAAVIEQWSAEMGRPEAEVRATVERELATASYRADGVEVAHLIEVVRRILERMQ